MNGMCGDGQLATKRRIKFLHWLLPASVIAVIMMSGCNADTRDEQDVGSGTPRPYSSIAVNTDSGAIVDETASISIASAVDFNDGKLSVSLMNMPMHHVIKEISRQTGIDFQFMGEHPAFIVNMQFSSTPVEKGLRLLLSEVDTIIVYADTNGDGNHGVQIIKVFILPEGENRNDNNGMTEIVDSLSVISEQFQNLIPRSYQDVNAGFSMNDTLTDQALSELTETLSERILNSGQTPN